MSDNDLLQVIADMMDAKLEPLKAEIKDNKEQLTALKTKVGEIDRCTEMVQTTLTNELSEYMNLILKRQTDMSRKLGEVVCITSDIKTTQVFQPIIDKYN